MRVMSDKKLDKNEVLQKIRELHDEIKMHPYWNIFDHGMFRNEVYPTFGDLMKEIANLYHYTDYPVTPIICIFKVVYHDFNAMRTRIYDDKDTEQKDEFKMFYLPVMQAYLQLAHMLIEGLDKNPETISMIMPNSVHKPTWFLTYVPVYKDSWINNDGYKFYYDQGWHAVVKIRECDVEKFIKELNMLIDIQMKKKNHSTDTLIKHFKACVKDIQERTSFIYKVV